MAGLRQTAVPKLAIAIVTFCIILVVVCLSLLAAYRVLLVAGTILLGGLLILTAVYVARRSTRSFLIVAVAGLLAVSLAVYYLVLRKAVSWAGPAPGKNLFLASLLIVVLAASIFLWSRWHDRRVIWVVVGVGLPIAMVATSALKRPFNFLGPPPDLYVNSYEATVVAVDDKPGQFVVREQLELSADSKHFVPADRKPLLARPPREITSTRRGLILHEVRFALPEVDSSGYAVKPGPDAHGATFSLSFVGKCSVHLEGLKAGSFLAADNTDAVAHSSYLMHETVGWSLSVPAKGVCFAYVASPFQSLGPPLMFLAGLSGVGSGLIAVILVVCSTIFIGVVKPALLEYVKRHLIKDNERAATTRKTSWRRRPTRTP